MTARGHTARVIIEKHLTTVGEEGTTVLEIATETGISQSTTRTNLNELERIGRVRRRSGHNVTPDTWWPKVKALARPEYSAMVTPDGTAWKVLRQPAGDSGTFADVGVYGLEAAAVEVAHMLNGWADREL